MDIRKVPWPLRSDPRLCSCVQGHPVALPPTPTLLKLSRNTFTNWFSSSAVLNKGEAKAIRLLH